MKALISCHPWTLYQVRCHIHPFCWYFDAGPDHKADFRDDGLIYRAGFKTREEAEAWAKKEGIVSE